MAAPQRNSITERLPEHHFAGYRVEASVSYRTRRPTLTALSPSAPRLHATGVIASSTTSLTSSGNAGTRSVSTTLRNHRLPPLRRRSGKLDYLHHSGGLRMERKGDPLISGATYRPQLWYPVCGVAGALFALRDTGGKLCQGSELNCWTSIALIQKT